MKTGLLLINTGSPEAPTVPAVRRFLREFLSDPYILDMSPVARSLLLNLVILPRRPRRSAAAYRAIWRREGSPLLYYSEWLRDSVAAALGGNFRVAFGMRYGQPSLTKALKELESLDRLVVLPLFPQYAAATTGSALAKVEALLNARQPTPEIRIIESFYADPGFIEGLAAIHAQSLRRCHPDHILFSFHGLPERQVIRSEGKGVECDRRQPCPPIGAANQRCYRAQCFATARALAAALDLTEDRFTVAFQSRLGTATWIGPYTEETILQLRRRGVAHLMVASPAFVADNLETLEELDIRLRRNWRDAGGKSFELVPSLNARPEWVRAVVTMVQRAVE